MKKNEIDKLWIIFPIGSVVAILLVVCLGTLMNIIYK